MKCLFSVFLFFSVIRLFAQEGSLVEKQFDIAEAEQKAAMKNFYVHRSPAFADDYDLKYHRLEFYVDPNVYSIQGAVTSYLVPISSSFNEVDFDMTASLSVDSVLYHSEQLSSSHSSDDILRINLPSILPQ